MSSISSEQSYLGRALGVNSQIEIDYLTFKVEPGDTFVLATDGVYEHVGDRVVARMIKDGIDDLDQVAKAIVELAYELGSKDNLTVQIVRIDEVPDGVTPARYSVSRMNCRRRRCWKHGRCSTATGSSGNCTAPAEATFTSPSTSKPTRWSPSRSRRSTCATIPTI